MFSIKLENKLINMILYTDNKIDLHRGRQTGKDQTKQRRERQEEFGRTTTTYRKRRGVMTRRISGWGVRSFGKTGEERVRHWDNPQPS